MKPHPHPPIIRKTIKWGGAAVTVLLVVVWIGSGWGGWYYLSPSNSIVGVQCGQFEFDSLTGISFATSYGWNAGQCPFSLRLWFDFQSTPFMTFRRIPVWPPAIVFALVTTLAWRLDTLARRRARLNLCPKCNYDRAGIAKDAVCPECGEGVSVKG